MSFTSPYYWGTVVLGIGVLTSAVSHVMRRHPERYRGYRLAIVIYVLTLCVFGTLFAQPYYFSTEPGWPAVWVAFPWRAVVGFLMIFVAGHVLGGLHAERFRRDNGLPTKRAPHPPRQMTAAERRAAEVYDDAWQIQDRERNRRLGTGPRW